jgi:hypothetical protein
VIHPESGARRPVQGDPSGIGRQESGDDVEASGLAGAVWAQQSDRLAALHRQSHPAQHRALLETLADIDRDQAVVLGHQLRRR